MDPQNQKTVLEAAERFGKENVVVVLGSPDPESASIAAETVTLGDPTFAGPLAGVSLGLQVFHVTEPAVQAACDADVFEEQVGLMSSILPVEEIQAEMEKAREAAGV